MNFKNRAEKRSFIKSLSTEYGVSFALALKAVDAGVHFRAIALATGENNKAQAFTAAVYALVK